MSNDEYLAELQWIEQRLYHLPDSSDDLEVRHTILSACVRRLVVALLAREGSAINANM